MKKLLLFACMCTLALCLATPLAADDDGPGNLVRADTDEGDFFIVSEEVPDVKDLERDLDIEDTLVRPDSYDGDAFIVSMPGEGEGELDVPLDLVQPGTTDGDAFIISLPEGEDDDSSGSTAKTAGGLALVGCLGAGVVVAKKR